MSEPRVFCVGRNYAAHARELGNALPAPEGPPILFLKPASALVPPGQPVPFPTHGRVLHFETELVLAIGRAGRPVTESEAADFVSGMTLGFDLTLRDVQDTAKKAGMPWEAAKAFDHSAPCGPAVPGPLRNIVFFGDLNGQRRQAGDTHDMIFPPARLLVEIGKIWALRPGDLVFTGTPEGVGPCQSGDVLTAHSPSLGSWSWTIA